MLISQRRNFIFLHTPKTAGTSVSLALAKNMAPDDIMVGGWLDARANKIPFNEFALNIAQKYQPGYKLSCLHHLIRYGSYSPRPSFVNNHVKTWFRENYGFTGDAHTPAKAIRAYAPELWKKAYKFAFVRNPWTHAVSNYKWCTKLHRSRKVSFREFLLRNADKSRPDPERVRPPVLSNWEIYTIDDQIVADFVGRFETIDADLETISKKLGFRVSIRNFKAKTGVRSKKKNISNYYDEECVELVRKIYRKEIDAFSYQVPF